MSRITIETEVTLRDVSVEVEVDIDDVVREADLNEIMNEVVAYHGTDKALEAVIAESMCDVSEVMSAVVGGYDVYQVARWLVTEHREAVQQALTLGLVDTIETLGKRYSVQGMLRTIADLIESREIAARETV